MKRSVLINFTLMSNIKRDLSRYLHRGEIPKEVSSTFIHADNCYGLCRVGFKRKFTASFFSINPHRFSLWFIITHERFKLREGRARHLTDATWRRFSLHCYSRANCDVTRVLTLVGDPRSNGWANRGSRGGIRDEEITFLKQNQFHRKMVISKVATCGHAALI